MSDKRICPQVLSEADYLTMQTADIESEGALAGLLRRNGHASWTGCPACLFADFVHVENCRLAPTGAADQSNVIQFPGEPRGAIEPDAVIEWAKGRLQVVAIVGYEKKDGNEYFACSHDDGALTVWLLERFKAKIIAQAGADRKGGNDDDDDNDNDDDDRG